MRAIGQQPPIDKPTLDAPAAGSASMVQLGRSIEAALKGNPGDLPAFLGNLAAWLRLAGGPISGTHADEPPGLLPQKEAAQFATRLNAEPMIKKLAPRGQLALRSENIDRLLDNALVRSEPLAFVSTILRDVDPTYTELTSRSLCYLAERLGELKNADGRLALALSELARIQHLDSDRAVIKAFFGETPIRKLVNATGDALEPAKPLPAPDMTRLSAERDSPGGIYPELADRFMTDHARSFQTWSEVRTAGEPFGISFASGLPKLSPASSALLGYMLHEIFTASDSAARFGAAKIADDVGRSLLEHIVYASGNPKERNALPALVNHLSIMEQEINELCGMKLIDASAFRDAAVAKGSTARAPAPATASAAAGAGSRAGVLDCVLDGSPAVKLPPIPRNGDTFQVDFIIPDHVQGDDIGWRSPGASKFTDKCVWAACASKPYGITFGEPLHTMEQAGYVAWQMVANALQSVERARAERPRPFEGRVSLCVTVNREKLRVEVQDNGAGIRDEVRPYLLKDTVPAEFASGCGDGVRQMADAAERAGGTSGFIEHDVGVTCFFEVPAIALKNRS
jgi:hypothetical protein